MCVNRDVRLVPVFDEKDLSNIPFCSNFVRTWKVVITRYSLSFS